jgi:RNA polymerase sigma-70 factor (ECF subfamily)
MVDDALTNGEVADIFRRYGHLLLRRCRFMMRDAAAAEDVLQETFVKIMRHGAAYRAADTKLSWLYRVADNCCFDALKKRRDRPPPLPLDGELEPRAYPTVDERLRVAGALDRLPARERQVAVLAFVDGLTQDQIATEIGWSRQTINRKLKEIRDRLGRWLNVNVG